MPEVDLGLATDWDEGETHGRVKLVSNRTYPGSPKKDVAIISPHSVEIELNSDFSSSQEADKVYFTTHHGSTKKVIAVLDSNGNLSIAGKLLTDQKNLQF
ncbi:DUF6342 family protein [Streptomyces sp. NPDC057217]|uniref:DUF6342 family protein n=1 Tax=Streptomyces sp. NPDC057217 TaxID=3346054 RepID=UPI003624D80E